MSGCAECLPSPGEQDTALQTAIKEAKEHAVTHQKNVFIYKDEQQRWQYIEADVAREIGIQPTGGIVSFMQPVAT